MTSDQGIERRAGGPKRLRGMLRRRQSPLALIADHARALSGLQRRLERAVPATTRGHWHVAGVDTERLLLVVDAPVWASALRYRQGALLDAVAEVIGQRPHTCRITIEPPRLARRQPPRQLSAAASEHLRSSAASVDDPRLREALERLASRRTRE
jgi:hypothetical protein